MSENGQSRAAIVAAARAWIGTPYHHMADLKGVAIPTQMSICGDLDLRLVGARIRA